MKVAYTLDEASAVSVDIKDRDDNMVATLVNESAVTSGSQSATWDIKDISDGTYTVFDNGKGF